MNLECPDCGADRDFDRCPGCGSFARPVPVRRPYVAPTVVSQALPSRAVDLLARAAPMLSDRGKLNDEVKAFLNGRKT